MKLPTYEENQVVQESSEAITTEEAVIFVQPQQEAVSKSVFQMDDKKISWGVFVSSFCFFLSWFYSLIERLKRWEVSGFVLLVCASIIIFSNGYSI